MKTWTKSISSKIRLPKSKKRKNFLMISLSLVIFCLVFLFFFIPPVWKIKNQKQITVTQYSKKKGSEKVSIGPSSPQWTPYKNLSRHLISAVIASEDSRFYQHKGIDWEEIQKSLELNLEKNKYARGASTITQQVVKMAFLSRDKTIIRKLREVSGALLLERLVDKSKILEWYLNLVEFGDGIYGAQKASSHYFQTKPDMLSVSQSIHLALVLPSPNSWSHGLRKKSLTKFGNRRFSAIANKMRQQGFITVDQWHACMASGNFGSPILGYSAPKQPEIENPASLQSSMEGPLEMLIEPDPEDVETKNSEISSPPQPERNEP